MLSGVLRSYERFRPFTEGEAWGLFRLAALGEAFGWTLLIIGILLGKYVLPGNPAPVAIAGRIHGTLFLMYIAAVIATSPSQGWSFLRTMVAGIASVPPYGSLMFEQWAAHERRRTHLSQAVCLSVYYHWTYDIGLI